MIFCHSIHALLHGLFRCTCLIFIPKQKLIPFVAVIQMFVLHRMTCSIVKNFFGLNAYLAENTVPPNNSYWVLTSFVAMATAVQLAHTRISDKEILNAKLETAERWRGRLVGRAVGHHAIMQLRRAFGVRVKVCVVLHSQVTDFVVQLTAWHHNAGAPAAARLRKAYHRSVSTLFTWFHYNFVTRHSIVSFPPARTAALGATSLQVITCSCISNRNMIRFCANVWNRHLRADTDHGVKR